MSYRTRNLWSSYSTTALTAVRDLWDKQRTGVSVTMFQVFTPLATHQQVTS